MNGSTLVSTGELAANLASGGSSTAATTSPSPSSASSSTAKATSPARCSRTSTATCRRTKTGKNGRHPLPEPQDFEQWLEKPASTPKDQVVCYDAGTGSMAARLWWMLRWVGHDKVAVLDGGFAKWVKEGRPVTVDVPLFTPLELPDQAAQGPRRRRASSSKQPEEPLPARRARAGALPRRAGADRPGRRPHPRREEPLQHATTSRRDGTFKTPRSAEEGIPGRARQAARRPTSSTTAAPASPPATTCSRWSSPACRAASSTPARGASGAPTRSARRKRASRTGLPMFAAGAGYELYMGRWSRLLAPPYVAFAGVKNGERVLDVGTGTGRSPPRSRRPRLERSRRRRSVRGLHRLREEEREVRSRALRGRRRPGAAVSRRVVRPDDGAAGDELRSRSRQGGRRDAPGHACRQAWSAPACGTTTTGMEMLRFFWDEVVALDPAIGAEGRAQHEAFPRGAARRALEEGGPGQRPGKPLVIEQAFSSFDDYWGPFLRGRPGRRLRRVAH